MKFIETSIFTRRLLKLLSDDQYRLLQHSLVLHPELGTLIRGGGGLRKIRWKGKQRGKRGSVRVIYYWIVSEDTILMLFIYDKNERSDLTPAQIKMLRSIIEEEYP